MAKGFQQNQERNQALSSLGKDLTRRARSQCELCASSGEKLVVHEVPPAPAEPSLESSMFICQICADQIRHPARRDPDHWRCLNTSAWSEVPAVQVTAVRLLRALESEQWAGALLEQIYLEPEIEAWLES